jgi:hypothetical protein
MNGGGTTDQNSDELAFQAPQSKQETAPDLASLAEQSGWILSVAERGCLEQISDPGRRQERLQSPAEKGGKLRAELLAWLCYSPETRSRIVELKITGAIISGALRIFGESSPQTIELFGCTLLDVHLVNTALYKMTFEACRLENLLVQNATVSGLSNTQSLIAGTFRVAQSSVGELRLLATRIDQHFGIWDATVAGAVSVHGPIKAQYGFFFTGVKAQKVIVMSKSGLIEGGGDGPNFRLLGMENCEISDLAQVAGACGVLPAGLGN